MSKLTHIDTRMPVAFYACVDEVITDPEIVTLAEQMKMPRLLICSVPLDDAETIVQECGDLMNWLRSNSRWSARIEETLQCISEDSEGRAFLTAFMPIDQLLMLAEDLNSDGVYDLRPQFIAWQEMGATEGYFNGYRLNLDAIDAVEALASAS